MNVFVLVKEDQKETGVNDTPKGPYRTNSSQEGEYVDYEEVE
jgi:hypothetical protein